MTEFFLTNPEFCWKGHTNVAEHFPKISEDCRRLPRITRRCFDDTHNFRDKLDISEIIDIFTSEDMESPGCGFVCILRVVREWCIFW